MDNLKTVNASVTLYEPWGELIVSNNIMLPTTAIRFLIVETLIEFNLLLKT